MPTIEISNLIEGTLGGLGLATAGVPTAGTDELQTITITGTPTGGTFTLTFNGRTTAAIAYNAAAAAVQAALELLSSIGTGNVTGGGGAFPGTPVTITFVGALSGQNVGAITATGSFTGGAAPAIAVVETTPGVKGSGAGVGKGGVVTDTTNGKVYVNTGTALKPTWAVVGSQS